MSITDKATVPVITIDGPTASGKGTVSRLVAQNLGWHLLDSGALYRLVALAAQLSGVALDNVTELTKLAENLDVKFANDPNEGEIQVLLRGNDVTFDLRTEQCGNDASIIASQSDVRAALLNRQHNFRQNPGLLADGRDMGSVVFPDAQLKFFLTASQDKRAKRRYNQLKEKGIDVSLGAIFDDIAERDRRDSTRSASPLKPAADAVVIDTSDITVKQVVEEIMSHCGAVNN
jgi:cytidylate kinase